MLNWSQMKRSIVRYSGTLKLNNEFTRNGVHTVPLKCKLALSLESRSSILETSEDRGSRLSNRESHLARPKK